MKLAKLFAAAAAIFFSTATWAQAPTGYYDKCEHKSGQALLSSLCNDLKAPKPISYDGLWNAFKTTDVRPNGKIWDMYSTVEWTPGSKQCGSYKNVGDCYNREHSFPKSWFDDGKPMYSDIYHLYPTDGKVNGIRSNYPFGECEGGEVAGGSTKSLGKIGSCTYPGYTGRVFEPDDEYKGDFARSYFYMAAAYNNRIATWNSDMLAHNSYPAFSTWALNMLLDWHRQDPVSQKELDRNNAAQNVQGNRNPFIDHPELAEHIWGNKKTVAWTLTSGYVPELNRPANGSVIDLGRASTRLPKTITVNVKGSDLTENITASISSGNGFSVSPATLAAADVNSDSGTSLNITFSSSTATHYTATLLLKSGEVSSTCTLKAEAVDGLPALPATGISPESFIARWTYVGDEKADGTYTLDVRTSDGVSLTGYPRAVNARAEAYTVSGLDYSTTYTYTVASATLTSAPETVSTATPTPAVDVLYDGDLYFSAKPGESSDIAELLLDIEYIDDPITLTVKAPFQLSTDKADWATSTTISPEEDRVYMRMLSAEAGTFATSIVITSGEYYNDAAEAQGVVSATPTFIEDFEADATGASYYQSNGTYNGTAATWLLGNAGVGTRDATHGGKQSVCLGKNATSSIAMTTPKKGGAGTVELYARSYGSDIDANLDLEYSTDGGICWSLAGSMQTTKGTYKQYTFTVNKQGDVLLRLQQKSGQRVNIDDITVTDYRSSGIAAVETDYHDWDAYCRDGRLVIECTRPVAVTVYGIDGITYFDGTIAQGVKYLDITPGLYIVAVDDFSRRVLVK